MLKGWSNLPKVMELLSRSKISSKEVWLDEGLQTLLLYNIQNP